VRVVDSVDSVLDAACLELEDRLADVFGAGRFAGMRDDRVAGAASALELGLGPGARKVDLGATQTQRYDEWVAQLLQKAKREFTRIRQGL
jgi:hypothetical protein